MRSGRAPRRPPVRVVQALAVLALLSWTLYHAIVWRGLGAAPSPSPTPPPRPPPCWAHGLDWGDTNLLPNGTVHTSSPHECHQKCRERQDCSFWTFRPSASCLLLRDVMKNSPERYQHLSLRFPDPLPHGTHGVVSGPRECSPALSWFTEEDLLREVRGMVSCNPTTNPGFARAVRGCMASKGRNASSVAFHHWQARHATSGYAATYPHKEWEHCSSMRRTCTCHTVVRFGKGSTWVMRNTSAHGAVRCLPRNFPQLLPLPPRAKCECWTPPAERERMVRDGLYLTSMLHGGSSSGACDIPLATISPLFDALAFGWGESALHVALGLSAHCTDLPSHASVASWKQDAKGYRLPCNGLVDLPYDSLSDDTAVVYTMAIRHWQWIPLNLSSLVRGAVRGCFGVDLPDQITTGGTVVSPKGNPFIDGWEARGWTHPCCQYMVLGREAHRSLAEFTLLVALEMARALPPSDTTTAALYCFLWQKSGGGCVNRWFGYVGEALSIAWAYMTQRLVALPPKAPQCSPLPPPAVHRRFHGQLTHARIHEAFKAAVLQDGGQCAA